MPAAGSQESAWYGGEETNRTELGSLVSSNVVLRPLFVGLADRVHAYMRTCSAYMAAGTCGLRVSCSAANRSDIMPKSAAHKGQTKDSVRHGDSTSGSSCEYTLRLHACMKLVFVPHCEGCRVKVHWPALHVDSWGEAFLSPHQFGF